MRWKYELAQQSRHLKGAALLLGIELALRQEFIQLTTRPGMTYNELKRALIASSTYLKSNMKRSGEGVAKLPSSSIGGRAYVTRNGATDGGKAHNISTTNLQLVDRRG